MAGVRYAGHGPGLYTRLSRRVVAPSRFRPIGYRAGGPSPQPGPNPAAGPGAAPSPTPQPTPKPQPGPAPPPTTPRSPSSPGLGDFITGITDNVVAGGEIIVGVAVLGVGLLILLAQTGAGGQLARGAAAGARRAGRALPVVGAVL